MEGRGEDWLVKAGNGLAWQEGRVRAWTGAARQGVFWFGTAGEARFGTAGMARLGYAGIVKIRQGGIRQGTNKRRRVLW